MLEELHQSARALASRGLAIFPCRVKDKVPATPHGCLDASRNLETIDQWWRETPYNIGIATGAASGLFVVDIDGDDGEHALSLLEAKHGELPSTVEVITGRGRHLYFCIGEHGRVANSTGWVGTGIDVRGDGGYVIAPPSIHPSGRRYEWSVDSAAEYANAPDWLLNLLRGDETAGKGKTLEHWHDVLTAPIRNGERNATLASICGKLLHAGLDVILTNDLLLCVNAARCEPPLAPDEVENIVVSVGKTHLKRLMRP